ncbi:MAG: galactose oxidase-like domain-containing protein, partial [Acidimicrobiia bacterium]
TWGGLGLAPHDPTSTPDDPAANDHDLFCADITLLPDGRVLAVGGTDFYNEPSVLDRGRGDPADVGLVELEGLRSTRLFDPATDTFSLGAPMKYGRWYSSVVALPDGKVLAAGGTTKVIKNTQGGHVRRTETYDPPSDRWAENYVGPASENTLPQAARLNLMPDGKVYYAGVGHMNSVQFGFAVDEALFAFVQRFDPSTRTWDVLGPAPLGARANAFQVLLPLTPPYDSGELLVFGGIAGPNPSAQVAVPFTTVSRVHRSGTVEHRMAESLHHARWYSSGVLLPDGTVAAVGGSDLDAVTAPGIDKTVQITEVFDPRTGHWTEMAPNVRERSYHSSAVLMPDMRLLFGGHSPIGTLYGPQRDSDVPTRSNDDKDPSFEIWSPTYLFRGPRPRIEHAPAGLAWGGAFEITTPQAGEVESVVLLRLPSPQHVHDSDQRSVVLGFQRVDGRRLQVTAPPDGVVAPPGFYYLVVNRTTASGPVPSVARVVRVGPHADAAEAPQPFPDDAPAPVGGSATPPSDPSVPQEGSGPGPRIT